MRLERRAFLATGSSMAGGLLLASARTARARATGLTSQERGARALAGIDEARCGQVMSEELRTQAESARREARPRLVLAPGCAVAADTSAAALAELRASRRPERS